MTDQRIDVLAAHALQLARYGIPVFPLRHVTAEGACSCSAGHDCKNPGKHPEYIPGVLEHGHLGATADEMQVATMWHHRPGSNIGIPCGRESGIVVLDQDVKPGRVGAETLEGFLRYEGLDLPTTQTVRTGRPGPDGRPDDRSLHRYFRYPSDERLRASGIEPGQLRVRKGGIGPGLDLQGDGAYVVGPGSVRGPGSAYQVVLEAPIAELPDWVIARAAEVLAERARERREGGGRSLADALAGAVGEGERDDTLASYVGSLRRKLGDDREAEIRLLAHAFGARCLPPLDGAQVDKVVDSIMRREQSDPSVSQEALEWVRRSNPLVDGPDDPTTSVPYPWPRDSVWDAHRALAQIKLDGGGIAYTEHGWRVYGGGSWTADDRKATRTRAVVQGAVLRHVNEREMSALDTPALQAELRQWAAKSQNTGRINNTMTELAPLAAARVADFDPDPWALAIADGVVDLRSGGTVLRPHSPSELVTRVVPTHWDPSADCPTFRAQLHWMFPNDELRAYVIRLMGRLLVDTLTKEIHVFYGAGGNNGKSTLLRIIRDVLLGPYAASVDKAIIVRGRRDVEQERKLLPAVGARMLTLSEELKEKEVIDAAALKTLTGGEPVPTRRLFYEAADVVIRGKLVITTNYLPRMESWGPAEIRRLRIVPFERTLPSVDRDMDEVVSWYRANEGAGILQLALHGLRDFLKNGMSVPSVMDEQLADWMDEDDAVSRFIQECVAPDGDNVMDIDKIHDCFRMWLAAQGGRGMHAGRQELAAGLVRSGFTKTRKRVAGRRLWCFTIRVSPFPVDR